jgi:hypothetical protein
LQLGNAGKEIVGKGRREQKLDDAIGVGVGERLEQHRVDYAKVAVLAPMPSARAATAAMVKPGS